MTTTPWRQAVLAAAVAVLAGCGGGDGPREVPQTTRLVSFGDSLSDVGTYRTPEVAAIGGGQYTVNVNGAAGGTNWTEQLARELALPAAPCAARTGLNASGPLLGLAAMPPTDHPECTNYAQGGSRVALDVGPGNAALLAQGNSGGYLGALTEPVSRQIEHHLAAAGGSFAAGDLVTVLAGGNDAFMQLAALAAGAVTAQQVGQAMLTAGAQLAMLVREQLLAKGAQRVVLVLLPDIGVSASAQGRTAEQRAQLTQLSLAFNSQLINAFSGDARVLVVDAFTASEQIALLPAKYGLANSTQAACDPAKELAPISLLCTPLTTVAPDVSRYWFSDDVHLTPYGYQLLARLVADAMTAAGWLAAPGGRPCDATRSCTLAPLPQ